MEPLRRLLQTGSCEILNSRQIGISGQPSCAEPRRIVFVGEDVYLVRKKDEKW